MNVLLTGCAGFIGWKTAELLIDQGHTVVGIDNINDYYDVALKHWRLKQLTQLKGFQFHRVDLDKREDLETLFAAHKLDAVINLTASRIPMLTWRQTP
jgi:UDP-glucuronate 4-epimerase